MASILLLDQRYLKNKQANKQNPMQFKQVGQMKSETAVSQQILQLSYPCGFYLLLL